MILRVLAVLVVVIAAVGVLAAEPDSTQEQLAKAQSLAWSKHFDEAAAIYLDVLRSHPALHDAILGLARVRLWQGRYGEARRLFRDLLSRNAQDADAAEGAATAAYWSGDYRSAEREFSRLVAAHPERKDAQRSLSELRAASRPTERIDIGLIDDDQPFRGSRTEARASLFSDPLTRWDVVAGGYAINSEVGGRHALPFATIGNETVLPALRLTLSASIGAIRTPDHRTRAIGGSTARVNLPRNHSVALSFARRELLSNATRLYPFVDVTSLRWDHSKSWLASVGFERDRFSDRNSASAADAYALLPVAKPGRFTFWAGASALTRDTAQSRFYVSGITATRDPSGGFFHYTYRGAYDPYWTPHDLIEGRLILAIERRFGSNITMRLQGDGGRARDHAFGFYPGAGPSPFPSTIGQAGFTRRYEPWRIRFTSSMPVARGMTLDLGYEHSVTTFYRANSIHASLARRR